MKTTHDDQPVSVSASHLHRLRHIHHSPLFWIGAVFFLAAIAVYIFSEDLSMRPFFHQ